MPDKSLNSLPTENWKKDSYSKPCASDADELRLMACYGLIPALEKYADIPELKRSATRQALWRLHRRRVSSLLKKVRLVLRRSPPRRAA